MKSFLIGLLVVGSICGLSLVAISHYSHKTVVMQPQEKLAGGQYFINVPTSATSSIGSATQTLVLAADSARSYAAFCNSTTTTASYISLQIGATSTSPSGIQIPGGSCYEMLPDRGNLFTTNIYAQSVAGTSTLTVISQRAQN